MVVLGLAIVTRGNDRVHQVLLLGCLLLGRLGTDMRMGNQALEDFLQGFIGRLLGHERGLQCLNSLVHGLQGVMLLHKLVVATAAKTGHL